MATRIFGSPGHLIVEPRPDNDRRNTFGRHTDDHEQGRKLYQFLVSHVAFYNCLKVMTLLMLEDCPDWIDLAIEARKDRERLERLSEQEEEISSGEDYDEDVD